MTMRDRVESPLRPRNPDADDPVAAPADGTPPPRLQLRELTGWEEDYLERNQAEPNTARVCNEVLARCLVGPGEDATAARQTVRDLLVAERDRELVALRRLSLGLDISAQVRCPTCGEVSEADFSLDVLPLDFDSPPRQVTLEVPDVGEVVLRLPTAGDQEDLLDAGLESEAERRSWLLTRCVERYGDQVGGFDLDFARALPVRTRTVLESAIEKRLPALELEMAVECSHCGAPIVAPFDVPLFFFSS
jgi:endogenous inhibitor of DNA gyrase (YacG/DUF329 family)